MKKNKLRILENPKSLEKFEEFKIDGANVHGGCFPAIFFCFVSFCPALRGQLPDGGDGTAYVERIDELREEQLPVKRLKK